ncbi:MAG: leucyl/phenylalanyl-tRNA--protein transferase [Proteobacteria bacterium]|nr:leucyl/phenylalanyl-tRNA--protein transferase [Pseudomonadota bacterium]MDA1331374.1 leucyl/phenylalanyl-tRNA--protein transferase [Pseudomonadota bacterium]
MVPVLNPGDPFPPTNTALQDPDGLLAIGGDLSPQTLIRAYRSGIFPWFTSDQPILWWSPNPRLILRPKLLKKSRSLQKTLRKKKFEVTINQSFEEVMKNCGPKRRDDPNSWITEEMLFAYTKLFDLGIAKSVETWLNGKLVGGLYGVSIGRVFFGESMFSFVSDASKVALTTFADTLIAANVEMIDCQVHSSHLESLGAETVGREQFEALLSELIQPTDTSIALSPHI